ncbi:MAG: ABC transporter permease [Mangrovibacterium sp.]
MNFIYHTQTAFRAIMHNWKPTILLVISTSIGLVTFILVSAYVTYEQVYDKDFPDSENIFRIVTDVYSHGELIISKPECERALGTVLTENFPEVLDAGFLAGTNNPQYKIGENIFNDQHVYHASPGFLDIFSIRLLQGNPSEVLRQPYTVLLSEATARKYFGNENPVGKTILKYPAFEYRVEGVFRDISKQAHFRANMLLSFHDQMHLPPPVKDLWGETVFYTYLKIKPGTDLSDLENKMNQLVLSHKKGDFEESNLLHQYHLQALQDIHLHSHLSDELQPNAHASYVYLLLVISFLVVVAAGLNYVHFSFAKSLNNAVNTALRKVVGASRSTLVWQSLLESLIIHAASIAVALVVCFLLAPYFQHQFQITVDFSFRNQLFWIGLAVILSLSAIANGIISGLLIGRYNSLELFRLKYTPLASGISFRQLFVAVQFVIVIFILVAILGINKQLIFLKEKDTGMNIENTLVVKIPQNMSRTSSRINNLDVFEQELIRNPNVQGITQSSRIPGELPAFNFSFSEKGTGRSGKAAVLVTGLDYFKIFQISFLAVEDLGASTNRNAGCIINQSCLAALGYNNPEGAVGKILNLQDESGFQNLELVVKGVCADFNFRGMREKSGPMIFFDWTENMVWGNYLVKLNSNNQASVIPFIHEKFKATFPNFPFEYLVLEDFYNQQFHREKHLLIMLQAFVLVAIVISTINLFAMAWFIAIARTKEIGIRKVNGARVSEVMLMLNRDFVKWVAIAFVIATPVAWYAMHKWLESFAYKTTLSWWIFALAGLLALGITLLTVSWQSWKAATRNPVEALRYE